MELTTNELADSFREGVVRGVHWDTGMIQRAAECLSGDWVIHLPELALVDNHFVNECSFRALLQLLTTHQELARLYISQEDLSPLLKDIPAVFGNHHNTLLELELVASRCKIRDADAIHLKQLVQIPSKSLSITFNLKQKDYGPCLLSLRQGLDQLRAHATPTTPRVVFRNVSFPDHEFHLHRFVAMVCEAQCVDSLQLNPRRRRAADASESMRIMGPGFLQALARLLAHGRVASLEVTNLVMDASTAHSIDAVVPELYRALVNNTTLERLSMPFTKGLARVWQQAIFSALQVNRTVRRLEFGHEVGIIPSFLQHLPLMQGLQSIQAPWRDSDGPMWVSAVQQTEALVQANFVVDLHQTLQSANDDPNNNNNNDAETAATVEDATLVATRQLVERNRLTQLARQLVNTEPTPRAVLDQLADMTQVNDVGLDARFVVLRETLALFAL